MRTDVKGYFLKEYGSWSVLTVSFLAGVLVSHACSWKLTPLFVALGLLINSKQAFTKVLRGPAATKARLFLAVQLLTASVILVLLFRSETATLLPLLVLPAAYLLMNKLRGEHFILTELLGFSLISLAAVLSRFLLAGVLDPRLFLATALYFTAGVFKVKSLLLKRRTDRVMTVLYVLFAAIAYRVMNIPVIVILPLAESVVAAITLYKVKLRTIGWIEVIKSVVFLGLLSYYFR